MNRKTYLRLNSMSTGVMVNLYRISHMDFRTIKISNKHGPHLLSWKTVLNSTLHRQHFRLKKRKDNIFTIFKLCAISDTDHCKYIPTALNWANHKSVIIFVFHGFRVNQPYKIPYILLCCHTIRTVSSWQTHCPPLVVKTTQQSHCTAKILSGSTWIYFVLPICL